MFNNYLFNKHLIRACLAAVFALGLAACSSSSDQATAPDPMPAEPDPEMACTDAGGRWNADMTCTSAEELTQEQLDALKGQIAALRDQLGLDADDSISGGIAELQDEITRLQDMIDARDAKDQTAADKAAAAKAAKIFAALDDPTAATASVTAPATDITAKYGMPTTLLSLTVNDSNGTALAAPNPVSPRTFEAKNAKSISALGSWSGTEVTAKTSTTMDTARVYTNIDGGKRVAFADVYGAAPLTPTDAHAPLISFSGMAMGSGSMTHRDNAKSASTVTVNDEFHIGGTFAGAPGRFRCDATSANSCISTVADGGGVTLSGGIWTFTPNAGAMALQADDGYQWFGWWMHKAADDSYHFAAFTGSTANNAAPTALGALQGTATYRGAAVGTYAMYAGGAKSGDFTADAELTADFGDGTAEGTISGMIDNFSGAGMNGWSLELQELNLNATGAFSTATDETAGATTDMNRVIWSMGDDDAADPAGMWAGQLYNEVGTGEPRAGTPQAAVGTFTAEYGPTGHMIGAFGADLQ